MIRRAAFAIAVSILANSPAGAEPSPGVVQAVEARAKAAGFDGAILIGDADGSQRTLTLGSRPVDPRATWRWASITKQLAAVIAFQEVAAGRLDLDAPVSRYWPDWKAPNAATIRIRDLLNHNSGLPQPDESTPDADGVPAFYRSKAASPADSAANFCAGPAKAKPPAKFDYNNCDTIVLAEVLARIIGKPFPALVQERLAEPLKLTSVGMFEFGRPRVGHVLPIGEVHNLDGLINLGVNGASAGAYGTIGDLWRFDVALLAGKLVPKPQLDQMWTASASNGFLNAFQWTYPAPLKGCASPVKIVERQGLVGGIELRNYLLPETGRALIMFSRKRPTNLGDPWE
ncbi:MAG: beta-lactamase family protein, partial [Sphingomonas sp.]|nr:beta-lactamase family protein [Sphingomonas sp.]